MELNRGREATGMEWLRVKIKQFIRAKYIGRAYQHMSFDSMTIFAFSGPGNEAIPKERLVLYIDTMFTIL